MANKQEINERKKSFLDQFSAENGYGIGNKITFEKFREVAGNSITLKTVENTLQGMRGEKDVVPGTVLVVGRNEAWLEWTEANVFEGRMRHRPHVKEALGRAIWNVLFRYDLTGATGDASKDEVVRMTAQTGYKIDAIRTKSPISLLIDSGSTTIKVVERLIRDETVPVRIRTSSSFRLASLDIITNCPHIAMQIDGSRHTSNVRVTVVGGELRPTRGSICGPSAQHWMRMWHGNDIRAADISIVGSTGYERNVGGDPGFCSGNLEEAQLKAAFLSASLLRIVVLDSDKLRPSVSSRCFAAMSSATIDLIVTDQGKDNEAAARVVDMLECASREGVATCVCRVKESQYLHTE